MSLVRTAWKYLKASTDTGLPSCHTQTRTSVRGHRAMARMMGATRFVWICPVSKSIAKKAKLCRSGYKDGHCSPSETLERRLSMAPMSLPITGRVGYGAVNSAAREGRGTPMSSYDITSSFSSCVPPSCARLSSQSLTRRTNRREATMISPCISKVSIRTRYMRSVLRWPNVRALCSSSRTARASSL